MSTKQKLLDEINKKANRMKDLKRKAKEPKNLESLVFDFFREVENMIDTKTLPAEFSDTSNQDYISNILIRNAAVQLAEQVRINFDKYASLNVVFNNNTNVVNGVRIIWSYQYCLNNKCSDTLYIGVEQMLFS